MMRRQNKAAGNHACPRPGFHKGSERAANLYEKRLKIVNVSNVMLTGVRSGEIPVSPTHPAPLPATHRASLRGSSPGPRGSCLSPHPDAGPGAGDFTPRPCICTGPGLLAVPQLTCLRVPGLASFTICTERQAEGGRKGVLHF